MDGYENNTIWDLKFINAVKEIKTHKCCPNDTFPSIDYNFLLTRYPGRKNITIIVPTIGEQNQTGFYWREQNQTGLI